MMTDERKGLGWGIANYPSYVEYYSKDDVSQIKCQNWIDQADILICGSAPEELIQNRIKQGKLVLRYSERPLKRGFEPLKYFPRLIRWQRRNPLGKPIYLLCASAYTASDYHYFGLFENRTYKWGYFPETKKYDIEQLIANKRKKTVEMLWAGRFIGWKHPELALIIAEKLKADGIEFQLNMIGDGELRQQLQESITAKGLENQVKILGSMPPEQVREHMERTSIFLFTSDFNEGWGAVLNEAMNSGCAVAASHAIGSVPFLLRQNETGMIYRNGDIEDLYDKITYLIQNQAKREILGRNAYHTITDLWNAEVAAQRLLNLCDRLLKGEDTCYLAGPCSKAEIIKHDWIG